MLLGIVWWVLPLAVLVGVSLGALGGGGAILTVPILVYLLHLSPSAATSGSLIIVALTSLAGLVAHYRKGHVLVRQGLLFGAAGVVGSLVGSRLSTLVAPAVLMTTFGVLMTAVGVLMLRRRDGDGEGSGESRGWGIWAATATGVGLLTGFFGVGGGFAVVPALALVLGLSMPQAVGTSLLVIVINSLTALGGRIAGGLHVPWPLVVTFSVFAAVGSLLGGRLAHRVEPHKLRMAFAVLLFAVSAYVLAVNVPKVLG